MDVFLVRAATPLVFLVLSLPDKAKSDLIGFFRATYASNWSYRSFLSADLIGGRSYRGANALAGKKDLNFSV